MKAAMLNISKSFPGQLKVLILLLIFSFTSRLWACNVCKRNQPEGLENITHGVGPEGMMDYAITYSSIVIVGIAFILSLKYLLKPGEKEANHIKNIVLYERF